MNSLNVSNPFIRNGPACYRFESQIKLSIDKSLKKFSASVSIVAEVLTVETNGPGPRHQFVVDLNTADINRCNFYPRKFTITNGGRVLQIFCNDGDEAKVWAMLLRYTSARKFEDYYRKEAVIGEGRHSEVFLAHALNDSHTKYVVKVNKRVVEHNGVPNRSQYERDAHLELIREFNRKPIPGGEKKIDSDERRHRENKIQSFLDKLMILRDSFGTEREDFLVFEYHDGELLSQILMRNGRLPEKYALLIIWDILTTLHYMHQHGVVHRDVRASNIFVKHEWASKDHNTHPHAMLFDLSEARLIPGTMRAEEPFLDSPGYTPYKSIEILSGRYHGKATDIWSCGVLLYKMLCGSFPFKGQTEREVCDNIKEHVFNTTLFQDPIWDTISPEAILLIKQMLQPDPFKRISALGGRSHKWITKELYPLNEVKSVRQEGYIPKNESLSPQSSSTLPSPYSRYECDEESLSDSTSTLLPSSQHSEQHDPIPPPPEPIPSGIKGYMERLRRFGQSVVDKARNRDRADAPAGQASPTSPRTQRKIWSCFSVRNNPDNNSSPPATTPNNVAKKNALEKKRAQELFPFFPDIKRTNHSCPRLGTGRGVSHRCNAACSAQTCVKTDLLERWNRKVDKAAAKSKFSNTPVTKTQNLITPSSSEESSEEPSELGFRMAPDRVSCIRKQNRLIGPAEILPSRRCLDDDVFAWASKTKIFAHVRLRPAPADPMFLRFPPRRKKGSASNAEESTETPPASAHAHAPTVSLTLTLTPTPIPTPAPLRPEMYIPTHLMKSVVTVAHVGLPQLMKTRPAIVRTLLGSPTVGLQLSILLPYRRKLRTTALAFIAVLRMVSMKKGLCLTRRLVRGEPYPDKFYLILRAIRREWHREPLLAVLPKGSPADQFQDGDQWRKRRIEPEPDTPFRPISFLERQYEVKKGALIRGVNNVKNAVNNGARGIKNGAIGVAKAVGNAVVSIPDFFSGAESSRQSEVGEDIKQL